MLKKKSSVVVIVVTSVTAVISAMLFTLEIVRIKDIYTMHSGEFDARLWERYPEFRHLMVKNMEEKIDIWNVSQEDIVERLGTNLMEEAVFADGSVYMRYLIDGWRVLWFRFGRSHYTIWISADGVVHELAIWRGK